MISIVRALAWILSNTHATIVNAGAASGYRGMA
jgi:hypothetical protein